MNSSVPEHSHYHLSGQSGGFRVLLHLLKRFSLSGYLRFAIFVHVYGFLVLPYKACAQDCVITVRATKPAWQL